MDATNIVQRVLHDETTVVVRARGFEYLRQGRVALLHCGSESADAKVKGTDRYHVRLRLENASLDYECSCPFAETGALCKHVWAVALELDHNEIARPFRLGIAAASARARGVGEPKQPIDDEPETAFDRVASSAERERERSRWQRLLGTVPPPHALPDASSEDWFLIDRMLNSVGFHGGKLVLHMARRALLKRSGLGRPTGLRRPPTGSRPEGLAGIVWDLARSRHDGTAELGRDLCRQVLPELAGLGRLGAIDDPRGTEVTRLAWVGGPPWRVVLDLAPGAGSDEMVVEGTLEREAETGCETVPASRATPLPADLLMVGDHLYELERGHGEWLRELQRQPLTTDRANLEQIARGLLARPGAPRFRDLSLIGWNAVRVTPRALLRLSLPANKSRLVEGTLTFAYGEHQLGWASREMVLDGRLLERDVARESEHLAELSALGVQVGRGRSDEGSPFTVSFDVARVADLIEALTGHGFVVEVEGKPFRRFRGFHPIVESEQDWFDLEGDVQFEGELLTMPELLRAVRNREHWVRLKDGSLGLLPETWLDSLAALADWVPPRASRLRFHMSQAGWLESLLGGVATLRTDAGFAEMKASLRRFDGVTPLEKPDGFRGELREYQALALGWLHALDELGFGGCLADDMGLGKTVVVLAWLLHRKSGRLRRGTSEKRPKREPLAPSLVVVPKSLLLNWFRECERFTPSLSVLIHHGIDRRSPGPHFRDFDVVLTSYGTLRRDVESLRTIAFDVVVLDEAHSIKNSWTGAHQAANSLDSQRRLGLTGTPVENHLGELWSLMSFLNPTVFSGLGHLKKAFEHRRPSRTALEEVIARSVQPFILRRTKSQVAKDLPERIEKTLHVTLSKEERRLYDELAAFFKRRILERRTINRRTQGKSRNGRETAEALEALLRLRQAACHPGLLDDARRGESSSKLDLLLEQLEQLRAGGHKALVFSQFTKLLGLLIPRLEAAGISHAYLDGKTENRQAVVDRFQADPDLSVFLISLKAGGVGLNLVAAEYVYLLDPWWNPASEAQAIDRAHRIGQTRPVIAYRLLSTGTVEEKVAALQDEKRELAMALFGDERNFSAKFTREDLEALID